MVNERIQQVKDQLPVGVEVAMGPVSTGLGEIFMYTVEAKDGAKAPGGGEFRQILEERVLGADRLPDPVGPDRALVDPARDPVVVPLPLVVGVPIDLATGRSLIGASG